MKKHFISLFTGMRCHWAYCFCGLIGLTVQAYAETPDRKESFEQVTRPSNTTGMIGAEKRDGSAEVKFAFDNYRRYANEAKGVKNPAKEQAVEAYRQYYGKNGYRRSSLDTSLSAKECISQLNDKGQFVDMIELENKHRANNLVQLSYSGPQKDLGLFMSEAHNRIWKIAEAYRDGKITEQEALTPKYLQAIIHYGTMEMSRSNSGPRFHASCFAIPTATVNTYFCFLKQMDEVETGKCNNPLLVQACDILKAVSLQSWTQPLRNDETDNNITHIERFRNHVWWVGGNALAYRSLLPCAFMYRSIPMVDVLAEVGQKCISTVSQNTYNDAFWREGFTTDGAGWGHGMQCLVWGYPIDGTSSALTLLGSLKNSPWEQKLNRQNVDALMSFFRGSNWYYYKGYVLPCLDRYSAVYQERPEPIKYAIMINKLLQEWSGSFTAAEIAELKQLQQEITTKQINMAGFPAGEYAGTRWFFNNDDLIKKSPESHIMVNMASVRCDGLESAINFADEYNFYTADGQTLFQKRGDEYRRIIGAWDVTALPGITARKGMEQLTPVTNWRGYCSKHNFAGGATRGGENAVGGFYFEKMNASDKDGVNDKGSAGRSNPTLYGVKAHKSYFMLGDYFIALGAGITNTQPELGGQIHTTIDQTVKANAIHIYKNGKVSELATAGNAYSFLQDGKSVWVSQVEGFSYTILPEQTANASFIYEQKANEWNKRNQSNVKKSDLPKQADILRLWVDHGNAPVESTYGYVVYTGMGIPSTKKLPFEVLRNDTLVQAVQSNDKCVVEAVFYQKDQVLHAKGLTIKTFSPAVLLLEKLGKEYLLTVNDPEMNPDLTQMTVVINNMSFKVNMPQGEWCGKPVTVKIGR